MNRNRMPLLILIALALALLYGCDADSPKGPSAPEPHSARPASAPAPALVDFSLVAGSEMKHIEDELLEAAERCNLRLQLSYKGSVDTMLAMQSADFPGNAVITASSIWLRLGDREKHRVKDEASIARSPVALGILASKAKKLGWIGKEVTNRQIIQAVSAGNLTFDMTSATQSNSGFTEYLAVLSSLAGNPQVLTSEQLDRPELQRDIKAFLSGVGRSAGSSGWLAERFIESPSGDGIVNYESMLIMVNQERLKKNMETLYFIYPSDGLGVADFTLGYVNQPGNPANETLRSAYNRFKDTLLSDEFQTRILQAGFRAGLIGMNPDQAPKTIYNPEWGVEISRPISPVPWPDADVTIKALNLYQTLFRKPSATIIMVDVSGSMATGGLDALKRALDRLFDPEYTSNFFIQPGERDLVAVIPFNDGLPWRKPYIIRGNDPAQLLALRASIRSLSAGGGTNIYKPVESGWVYFKSLGTDLKGYLPAMILMTDGRSEDGSLDWLKDRWKALHAKFPLPPIFSITYGDAKKDQLQGLAQFSHGRVFDGVKDGLEKAFREAKGYN
jgi:Ca-activated chloride channel family protein